jgi:hypothetical protein
MSPTHADEFRNLAQGRLHWSPEFTLPHSPFHTVSGTIFINGQPACHLPVRAWRQERQGPEHALVCCLAEVPSDASVPLATRTDDNGHFVLPSLPDDEYTVGVLLPGQWNRAGHGSPEHPAAKALQCHLVGHDVNLGRMDLEVFTFGDGGTTEKFSQGVTP